MSDIRTVELTGAELAVEDICGSNVCVKNYGVGVVYASAFPGITAGAPGVMPIDPGTSAVVSGISRGIYLLGKGRAVLVGDDRSCNVFSQGGGSEAADLDDPIISCKSYPAADDGIVIDVSGAKYFGVIAVGDTGTDIAELSGDAYNGEATVYVNTRNGSYISTVPASGKIYANITGRHCVVYTSDSYPAIVGAVIARREGRL